MFLCNNPIEIFFHEDFFVKLFVLFNAAFSELLYRKRKIIRNLIVKAPNPILSIYAWIGFWPILGF